MLVLLLFLVLQQVLFFGYDTLDNLLLNTRDYGIGFLSFLCVAKVTRISRGSRLIVSIIGRFRLTYGEFTSLEGRGAGLGGEGSSGE